MMTDDNINDPRSSYPLRSIFSRCAIDDMVEQQARRAARQYRRVGARGRAARPTWLDALRTGLTRVDSELRARGVKCKTKKKKNRRRAVYREYRRCSSAASPSAGPRCASPQATPASAPAHPGRTWQCRWRRRSLDNSHNFLRRRCPLACVVAGFKIQSGRISQVSRSVAIDLACKSRIAGRTACPSWRRTRRARRPSRGFQSLSGGASAWCSHRAAPSSPSSAPRAEGGCCYGVAVDIGKEYVVHIPGVFAAGWPLPASCSSLTPYLFPAGKTILMYRRGRGWRAYSSIPRLLIAYSYRSRTTSRCRRSAGADRREVH